MVQRTVIVLKSDSGSTELYAEILKENHFNPIFIPTLSFGFKNLDEFRKKLLQPDTYAGLIFTSPRCVEAAQEALQTVGVGNGSLPGGWKMLHNYAVGEMTHNLAMNTLQQLFTHGKQTGNANNLADFIIESFDGSKDFPFLMPCGNLRTETLLMKLKDAGFKIDEHEVYETICNPQLAENMDRALKEDNVEFLAFFSPSGVDCTIKYFKERNIAIDNYKLVAIGPSTRRAIENQGYNVHCTAQKPTVEHLIQVLINPDEGRQRPTTTTTNPMET